MPYYFFEDALLTDELDFWEMLQEIWEIIDNDLTNLHFETDEEALSQKFRKSLDPNDLRTDSLGVARYRETDDRECLLYFYEQGLQALSKTKICIENRKVDQSFLYYWSNLISCHGFVSAAIMARGDDMQSKRAGAKSRIATSLDEHKNGFLIIISKQKRRLVDEI